MERVMEFLTNEMTDFFDKYCGPDVNLEKIHNLGVEILGDEFKALIENNVYYESKQHEMYIESLASRVIRTPCKNRVLQNHLALLLVRASRFEVKKASSRSEVGIKTVVKPPHYEKVLYIRV